jgi:hypothetical protein
LATAPAEFPGNVGGGGQDNAQGKPFQAKAWPRIGTILTQPVRAEGLDGARQEDHGETRDEQNQCPHRKPQDRNWTNRVIAMIGFARAKPMAQAPASASTVARRRSERRIEAMKSAMQPLRPVDQAWGGPRALK